MNTSNSIGTSQSQQASASAAEPLWRRFLVWSLVVVAVVACVGMVNAKIESDKALPLPKRELLILLLEAEKCVSDPVVQAINGGRLVTIALVKSMARTCEVLKEQVSNQSTAEVVREQKELLQQLVDDQLLGSGRRDR